MAIEIDNLYLNSFCFGYRFNDVSTTLPDFYAYYFRGDNFRKTVLPLAQGSTRYNISKNELLKVEVPIPSKTEQIKSQQSSPPSMKRLKKQNKSSNKQKR